MQNNEFNERIIMSYTCKISPVRKAIPAWAHGINSSSKGS